MIRCYSINSIVLYNYSRYKAPIEYINTILLLYTYQRFVLCTHHLQSPRAKPQRTSTGRQKYIKNIILIYLRLCHSYIYIVYVYDVEVINHDIEKYTL